MPAAFAPAFMCSTLALLFRSVVGTSSKMDFLPLGHLRTDPIISKTCLADHVHTFYGANVPLRPETTYEDLRAATESTGTVLENKGLYWHPSIYRYNRKQKKYTLLNTWFGTGYYIWETKKATAFPDGFSMIASGAASKSNFTCLSPSPCTRSSTNCKVPSSTWRFPQTACAELEIQLGFPTCWNGVDVTSADGTSHVAYAIKDEPADSPENEWAFPCPASHPTKLPEIRFYFRIKNYKGGHHVFSNGGDMPHADYMTGFSSTELQTALDGCTNPSEAASPDAFCETHFTFQDAPKTQKEDNDIFTTLQKYQPTVKYPTDTITKEPITNIKTLPRGLCTGTLIPKSPACRQQAPADDCYGLASTDCNLYYDSYNGGRACVVQGGYCDGDATGLSFSRCSTSMLGRGHLRKPRHAKARVLLQDDFEVQTSGFVESDEPQPVEDEL